MRKTGKGKTDSADTSYLVSLCQSILAGWKRAIADARRSLAGRETESSARRIP